MKRIFSMTLMTALLCALLSVGASALDAVPPMEEAKKNFSISGNIEGAEDSDLVVQKEFQVYSIEAEEYGDIDTLTSYIAITEDAPLTITNTGDGEGYKLTFIITEFWPDDQGVYQRDGGCYMVNSGGFIDDSLDPNAPEYGGLVAPAPGESVTFSIPMQDSTADRLYQVKIYVEYPEMDYYYYWIYSFMADEAAVAKARNGGVAPAPTTPPAPMTATPTASKVLVDGKETTFEAYTISENNYFKIRDIASVLSGTGKQFEVVWDGAKNAIAMTSGHAYTSVGGELAPGDGTGKAATTNTAKVYLDGEAVSLTAYTIGGNNFVKLRDLGQLFDFGVRWDGSVVIDTTTGY